MSDTDQPAAPIDEAERERLERVAAIETVTMAAVYARQAKMLAECVYRAAPSGSEVEKQAGVLFQHLADHLDWLERRGAILRREYEAMQPPAAGAAESTRPTVH